MYLFSLIMLNYIFSAAKYTCPQSGLQTLPKPGNDTRQLRDSDRLADGNRLRRTSVRMSMQVLLK